MSTTNSRFKTLANGLQSEILAEHTQLIWNPTTQAMAAVFNCRPYLIVGTEYMPYGDMFQHLRVELNEHFPRCLAPVGTVDPVTGADLSNISVAGIATLIKIAFDRFHNEDAERIAALIAAAEAEAAAQQAMLEAEAAEEAAAGDPPADEEPQPNL